MLEELGVPYELVTLDLSKGEHKRPEYLRVHPLGSVPALEDGGHVLFESAAILQYLADKYPEQGLAPAVGSAERGEYYQWMMFCMATLEPVLAAVSEHTRLRPEAERLPAEAERARKRFADLARVLEARLGEREVLVGDRFSAADVLLASALGWGASLGLLGDFPVLREYVKRHMARPAAQRAQR